MDILEVMKVLSGTELLVSQFGSKVTVSIPNSAYHFTLAEYDGYFQSVIFKSEEIHDTLDSSNLKDLIDISILRIKKLTNGEKLIQQRKLEQFVN